MPPNINNCNLSYYSVNDHISSGGYSNVRYRKIITSDISKSVKAQEVVTLEAVRALSRLISAEQNNILITRLNASL